MYFISTLVKQILHDMWTHKLRSTLAIFGIFWGTLTVTLLLALGHGFYLASKQNMMKIADGTLFIRASNTSKDYEGYPKGRKLLLKAAPIIQLQQSSNLIQAIAPALFNNTKVSYEQKQFTNTVFGSTPDFRSIRKINLIAHSRFINKKDTLTKAHVAIIGSRLKQNLFGDAPALNKRILIKQIPFIVIGVIQAPSKHVYNWYDKSAIIPYTTFISLWGNQNIDFFFVLPKPLADASQVKKDITTYLGNRYHFDPNDSAALKIFDTSKIVRFFTYFFIAIQLFLGICGALTLAVGCLGVTNIMFLIVRERTHEIGIRMAIGAKDWHIMLQFLLETLILVGIGGILGFTGAYLVTGILLHINLPSWLGKPQISFYNLLIIISILTIMSLLAAYFPARKAAKMDPVEAISLN